MKGKPIKFFAIAANLTATEASAYAQQTGLAMPVYADSLGMMQKRYGMDISLKNIYQYRVVGPNGKIVGYRADEEALNLLVTQTQPKWKYAPEKEPSPALGQALDLLEAGQYAPGMKLLAPLRKSANKRTATAAIEIYDVLKKQGEEWKKEAEEAAEKEPVQAYDLYSRIAAAFPGDELAKSAAGPLKKLQANKTVKADLTARKAYAKLLSQLSQLGPAQKATAAKLCRTFAKRYKDTPSAQQAESLATELGG